MATLSAPVTHLPLSHPFCWSRTYLQRSLQEVTSQDEIFMSYISSYIWESVNKFNGCRSVHIYSLTCNKGDASDVWQSGKGWKQLEQRSRPLYTNSFIVHSIVHSIVLSTGKVCIPVEWLETHVICMCTYSVCQFRSLGPGSPGQLNIWSPLILSRGSRNISPKCKTQGFSSGG